MWVEADPGTFTSDQRIAIKYDQNDALIEGRFRWLGPSGHVYFRDRNDSAMSASGHRTFYRWVEDKPEDSVKLDVAVDHSRLRLNKPDSDRHPDTQTEVEEAEASLLRRVNTLSSTVIVGRQAYDLKPGDHLRVWWEDGALWSELVQERTK